MTLGLRPNDVSDNKPEDTNATAYNGRFPRSVSGRLELQQISVSKASIKTEKPSSRIISHLVSHISHTMPRQGDGSSDNAIPQEHNIIHGAGTEEKVCFGSKPPGRSIPCANAPRQSTHVDRADKTAPLPEPEKGAALEDASGSAGDSKGKDQGGRSTKN